jgi:SAM-dependent methyltransferase
MGISRVSNLADRQASVMSHLRKVRRSLGRLRSYVEIQWALVTHGTDRLLRRGFNRWARHGRGESMERDHARIAETIWQRMQLSASDRILDLGCGQGWACRRLAERAPERCVIMGVDISDEMIRLAREKSRAFSNVTYHCGKAEQIPTSSGYFTKIMSIEAFYYFERQDEVLRELFRVMQPGGQLYLLLCLFEDHLKSPKWVKDIGLPVQNRTPREYEDMLQCEGWTNVHSRVFDFRPNPAAQPDAHDRALLITAQKPT